MDKTELKQMVAQLLREMDVETQQPTEPETTASDAAEPLADLAAIDLRSQYLVQSPANAGRFLALKKRTPARLGSGRAGARYKTITMLRFRADHAAAQDSVFSLVEPSFYQKHSYPFVQTMCKDKEEYLTRPDLGRKFDEKNQTVIRNACGDKPRILLVIGDGLSSNAITANAADCEAAIRQGLSRHGITPGKTLFVQYARVGASDHIGQITGAELVCMLVGERPGLVTSESMSAYITYKPFPGIAESKRTVISNIHRQGTPAPEAGAHIADVLVTILEKQASGIDLR